jgi:hypothetical protein
MLPQCQRSLRPAVSGANHDNGKLFHDHVVHWTSFLDHPEQGSPLLHFRLPPSSLAANSIIAPLLLEEPPLPSLSSLLPGFDTGTRRFES